MSQPPLTGLRVVELASEAGAYAGKLFGDAGADVILVEPPGGHPTRRYAPFVGDVEHPDRSLHFWNNNTSKRSVVLDPRRSPGARRSAGSPRAPTSCSRARRRGGSPR
jgi:crotonobetainyl-CoA:carnitine CoA-transferase CaiB-like acyl-CoA transferase